MVKAGESGIYLGEKFLPLISGSVQYFRLEREKWGEILDKVKELGFSIIETYIPWSVHEIEKGKFDFGEINKNYDITHFLSLCHEKNLYLLIRPGPHINAELTYFGYPKRIFSNEDLLSRDANGALVYLPTPPRMFPVPSYASEKFYQELEVYFDALCSRIKNYLYPQGPIIAVQADNEMSFFFRTAAYDQDYSEDSLKLYRKFLQEKYSSIDNLNKKYKSNISSFSEVEPPRDYCKEREKIYYHLDWCEFKEYYLVYGINKIAEMLRNKGITNIPIFHNYPTPFPTTPFNIIQTENKIDIQGIDTYPRKEDYYQIKRGVSFTSVQSRLPFVPEFSSGFTFPLIFLEDQKFTTLSLFMHGIKGVNFYMIVERERWYGSPIRRNGKIREEYFEFYKKLNQVIKENEIYKFNKKQEAIILLHLEYDRLQLASSLFSPFPVDFISGIIGIPVEYWVSENNLGFSCCIQKEYQNFWESLYKGFCSLGYPVDLGSTQIPLDKLSKYKLIILPTFDFMEKETQEKFKNLLKEGATILTGPRIPEENEFSLSFPNGRIKEIKYKDLILKDVEYFQDVPLIELEGKCLCYYKNFEKGKIIHLGCLLPCIKKEIPAGLKEIIEKISLFANLKKYFISRDPYIETVLQENLEKKILYVANISKEKKETQIEFEGKFLFKELSKGKEIAGENKITLKIEPFTILIFEVKEC